MQKNKGQLDSMKDFLPSPEKFVACSVMVPITMDKKEAITVVGRIVSAGIRSFEIWLDCHEKRL